MQADSVELDVRIVQALTDLKDAAPGLLYDLQEAYRTTRAKRDRARLEGAAGAVADLVLALEDVVLPEEYQPTQVEKSLPKFVDDLRLLHGAPLPDGLFGVAAQAASAVAGVLAVTKMEVASINPTSLRAEPDAALLSLHRRLHQLHAGNFAGTDKLTAGNLNREELVNAEIFVQAEMDRRGMRHEAEDPLAEEAEHLRAQARKYDPDQPRDELGRFGEGGGGPGPGYRAPDVQVVGTFTDDRPPLDTPQPPIQEEIEQRVKAAVERLPRTAQRLLGHRKVDVVVRPMAEAPERTLKGRTFKVGGQAAFRDRQIQVFTDTGADLEATIAHEAGHFVLGSFIAAATLEADAAGLREVEAWHAFDRGEAPEPRASYREPRPLMDAFHEFSIAAGAGPDVSTYAGEWRGEGRDWAQTHRVVSPETGQVRETEVSAHSHETFAECLRLQAQGRLGEVRQRNPRLFRAYRHMMKLAHRAPMPSRLRILRAASGKAEKVIELPDGRMVVMTRDADGPVTEQWFAPEGWTEEKMPKKAAEGDERLAPINPSGEGEGPDMALEEVLPHFRSFKLRMPFLYLVGSLANNGKSDNDIDVLMRGSVSEEMRRVIEFRLGRMLPPELSGRLQLHGDEFGGPFTSHVELADLVVEMRPRFEVKRMAMEKQDDPLLDWPKEHGPRPASLQLHYRGRTAHADLRFQVADYLVGWTLAVQRPGAVPEVATLEDARRISATFSVEGSRYFKPWVAPAKLFATPKARQPVDWMKIEAEVFEPGSVGATRYEEGIIVRVDTPRVEWGMQRPYAHEYFLTGGRELAGILYLRMLVGGPGGGEGGRTEEGRPFWTAFLSKEYLPSVLKPRTADRESMPPDGFSAMPATLEQETPEQFQFWKAKGAEAREIRDALVAERYFTPENVRMVNGQFRRVTTKFFLLPAADVQRPPALPYPDAVLRLAGEGALVTDLDDGTWKEGLDDAPPEAVRVVRLAQAEEVPQVVSAVRRQAAPWLLDAPDTPLTRLAFSEVGRPFKLVGPQGGDRLLAASFRPAVPVDWQVEGVEAEVEKQPQRVPFVVSWQMFKGPTVVRAAPSRQVWRLLLGDSGGGLEGWELQADPLSGEGQIAGLHRQLPDDALLAFEGEVPPGGKVGGTVLNDTKNTPSRVAILDRGMVEVLDDQQNFKKLRFDGRRLRGIYTITAEEAGGDLWLMAQGTEPGLPEPAEKAADHLGATFSEHARAWVKEKGLLDADSDYGGMLGQAILRMATTFSKEGHSGMSARLARAYFNFLCDAWDGWNTLHLTDEDAEKARRVLAKCAVADVAAICALVKAEDVRAVRLADGTTLDDVQVWNPDAIGSEDDRTNDRERLRPLALFQPMKAPARRTNEFRRLEEVTEFATPEALRGGVVVEPKYNGFRFVMEKNDDGRLLLFTEEVFNRKGALPNFAKALPGLAAELEKLPGPFVLDGEAMAYEGEDVVPRRDLATYRTGEPVDDAGVVVQVFRALHLPKPGNLLAQGEEENGKALAAYLPDGLRHVKAAPRKLVRTMEELRDAVRWAAEVPGSEGAMLKLAHATYSLGGENDAWAKLRLTRTVRAIVYERHPVKDSPGVYNLFCAVGPVPKDEAGKWEQTVEVRGKLYVPIGKTFNVKLPADVGDSVTVDVTELLLDQGGDRQSVTWFIPVVVGPADSPMTVEQVADLLAEGELKKVLVGVLEKRLPVLKTAEERYVLGVVLEPETVDSQKDIYSAQEVRQAAHRFMEEYQTMGLMHRQRVGERVKVLESYIAPVGFEVGGQQVKAGTWLLGVRVRDDALWQAVKDGTLTGFSIGGSAIRRKDTERAGA